MPRQTQAQGASDPRTHQEQHQSPLFSLLPLEIRRHVYLQLWLDYGLVQHIYLFGPSSFLSHYRCLLDKSAFKHHCPPSPPILEPEESAGEADPMDDAQPAFDQENGDNSADVGNGPNAPQVDPGVINGAIAQGGGPQSAPAAPAAPSSDPDEQAWQDSPWCMHKKCFTAYMEIFDKSFENGYSRNYRRQSKPKATTVGIAKPLLVCKQMYVEASQSLYNNMTFSFPDLDVLERFMQEVPSSLSAKIQMADVMFNTSIVRKFAPWRGTSHHTSTGDYLPSLRQISLKIGQVLASVQELRLSVHIVEKSDRKTLPDKEWFEPLCDLAERLKERSLRKLSVQLVTDLVGQRNDRDSSCVTYGSTPENLKDAPFSVALVPRGFHSQSTCFACVVDLDEQE
ncbi:unnamed protein product [Discula destructiva]